jgi:hypothetical protein
VCRELVSIQPTVDAENRQIVEVYVHRIDFIVWLHSFAAPPTVRSGFRRRLGTTRRTRQNKTLLDNSGGGFGQIITHGSNPPSLRQRPVPAPAVPELSRSPNDAAFPIIRMLRYPAGHVISVGQHIWWNEGVCIGYVEDVIETCEQMESWGLTDPSIAISNIHPFEAVHTKHPQQMQGLLLGDTVVYALSDLADEGVGLLSDAEEAEFTWADAHARTLVQPEHTQRPYCVSAKIGIASRIEHWHFVFLDCVDGMHQHVSFPFRPNTRTTDESPF